ncbi:MAG: hypothetical protein QXT47_00735 [Desulfurococcaceae archaeon]
MQEAVATISLAYSLKIYATRLLCVLTNKNNIPNPMIMSAAPLSGSIQPKLK